MATLAVSLLVLYVLTIVTGQPLTVALLGVVIAMMSAMAVNEPDPRQLKITMALLPVPAAAAVTAGALLAPHKVIGDVVFVAIIFVAVYVRRFDQRGMALGMVVFMTYFFALFLGAKPAQLPWLIGAIVIGTACSFVMRVYIMPDRPERVLRRTVRSLWFRIAAVVDTTGAVLQSGRLDERARRRLRRGTARLNEAALMIQGQLDDKVDAAMLWPGIDDDELALRLFDAELAAEQLVTAGAHAADDAAALPAATRAALIEALAVLAAALRGAPITAIADRAGRLDDELSQRASSGADPHHGGELAHRLVLAIWAMVSSAAQVRELVEQAARDPAAGGETTPWPPLTEEDRDGDCAEQDRDEGLRPTTRQAIQVAIAASLAIVAGELVSPARWYWAVIAAFVVFTGTISWGETLTKGWHRLLGTALGVPAGVLIATAVGGNRMWSVVLIFVCLFCGFYLLQVAQALMIFWITTMLALLYGLLGQFSVGVLLLRLEETAIGAVIGVGVAVLVLPTSPRTMVRDDARTFVTTLSGLVSSAVQSLLGEQSTPGPTEQARELDRQLQQLRTSAAPLTAGIGGLSGRSSTRHGLHVLTACDHYARMLARCSDRPAAAPLTPELSAIIAAAGELTARNIDALASHLDRDGQAPVERATELLDAAEAVAECHGGEFTGPNPQPVPTALHALRRIDQAVVDLAVERGATLIETG